MKVLAASANRGLAEGKEFLVMLDRFRYNSEKKEDILMGISEKEICKKCKSENTLWLGVKTIPKPTDPQRSISQKNKWKCSNCGHTFFTEISR